MKWLDWFFGPDSIVNLVHVRKGPSDAYHWALVARNGETLASSETYSSRQKCLDTASEVAAQCGVPLR